MGLGMSRMASTISCIVSRTVIGLASMAACSSRVQRQFGHAPDRPDDGADRQDRTDDKGDPHDHRNAVVVQHILRDESRQQGRREIGQGLRQTGERALRQKADRPLVGFQPVCDIGAVWLHRDVVARIEDPQQAGSHPERAGIWHQEQADRADDRADQEVRRAASKAAAGPVTHRADNRLDYQPGHRACKPQQRHRRFVRAKEAVNRPHIGLLQSKTELQAEKADIHFDDSQQRKPRFSGALHQSCPLKPERSSGDSVATEYTKTRFMQTFARKVLQTFAIDLCLSSESR